MSNNVQKQAMKSFRFLPTPTIVRERPQKEQERIPTLEQLPTSVGNGVSVSLSDRWAVLGKTGVGKTTWAKRLLQELHRSYPAANVYILDSKPGHKDFGGYGDYQVFSAEAPDVLRQSGKVQVWAPEIDDIKEYDTWFTRISRAAKPSIVLIDELANLSGYKGGQFPRGFAMLQKQGRGNDISIISLTQEAAYVPRQVFSQPTHVLQFKVLNEYDQRLGASLMGRPREQKKIQPKHKYGFFYCNVDSAESTVHEYSGYQDFFGL